ncbi:azurin [Pigmentiphaga soli]|uniref:Azurin n=1 Tax=Pigmentiphaga soli TaxID=1007095 RepID=A0ABP8HBT2_9BURK
MKLKPFLLAAAFAAVAPAAALAADCSATITGNDQMQFDKKDISVPKSCKTFKVTLKHSGTMARNVMGHNWVLSKAADMQPIVNDGMAAGLDKNYLKPGDARVIAATKVIGGGQSDTVEFDVAKLQAGGQYAFFCSFPGHVALMKGTVTLAP